MSEPRGSVAPPGAIWGGEHAIEVTPAAADIDELDHVSNLVYVRWVLEVALSHSRARGLDHARYREIGGIFVVHRHEIDYHAPCFAGDRVRVTTWVESFAAASSIRCTRIERLSDAAGGAPQRLASGRTTWAFVDLATGRPRRIPGTVLSC